MDGCLKQHYVVLNRNPIFKAFNTKQQHIECRISDEKLLAKLNSQLVVGKLCKTE